MGLQFTTLLIEIYHDDIVLGIKFRLTVSHSSEIVEVNLHHLVIVFKDVGSQVAGVHFKMRVFTCHTVYLLRLAEEVDHIINLM